MKFSIGSHSRFFIHITSYSAPHNLSLIFKQNKNQKINVKYQTFRTLYQKSQRPLNTKKNFKDYIAPVILLCCVLKTDFVYCFSCHSHSDIGNFYLLVLSKSYRINIPESTMTMTVKTRYKAPPLVKCIRSTD